MDFTPGSSLLIGCTGVPDNCDSIHAKRGENYAKQNMARFFAVVCGKLWY
jgi:hypothetical protein